MDPIRTARPETAAQIFGIQSLHLFTWNSFVSFPKKLAGPKSTELDAVSCLFQIIPCIHKDIAVNKKWTKLFSHRPSEKINMKNIFFIFCVWSCLIATCLGWSRVGRRLCAAYSAGNKNGSIVSWNHRWQTSFANPVQSHKNPAQVLWSHFHFQLSYLHGNFSAQQHLIELHR